MTERQTNNSQAAFQQKKRRGEDIHSRPWGPLLGGGNDVAGLLGFRPCCFLTWLQATQVFMKNHWDVATISQWKYRDTYRHGKCCSLYLYLFLCPYRHVWLCIYMPVTVIVPISVSVLGIGNCIHGASLVAQWYRIACQCRRWGFNPWVGKIPWRRKWQLTPVFLPGNPMDREAWWARVHRVTKSWIWLSD